MNCEMHYKNTPNVQPLYDYYVETDLDSVDDQPVDYSKKYTDQDSYEHCRPIKSPVKPNEFPSELPRTIKQSSSDEVKVYCIEGTPLTISSASSFCDLREVGTSDTVEKCKRNRLTSTATDGESTEVFEVVNKSCAESPGNKIGVESPSKEKDDFKEGKSVSFRNSNEISKASSPLMFSRSSSIASLNSFEQHSFIDDRSSVSAISAFTSGLISPSDLPDSPGDIMSPALTDKDSSPKIDVTKIGFSPECDNRFSEEDKIHNDKNLVNDVDHHISIQTHLTQAEEYVPVDCFKSGGRNSEEEENDDLLERLEVSNTSLDTDEVFEDPEFTDKSYLQSKEDLCENLEKYDDDSDGEDDLLLQQYINLGMSNEPEHNPELNKHEEDHRLPSQNAPVSQVKVEKENIMVLLDSDGKEENILINREETVEVIDIKINTEKEKLEAEDVINSDDDSDDELLENCILSGMPVDTKSEKVETKAKNFETQYSPHFSNYSPEKVVCKSDNDSDGDDDLLQRAILWGSPTESTGKKVSQQSHKRTEYCDVPVKTNILPENGKDHPSKKFLNANENGTLEQHCIKMQVPKESCNRRRMDSGVSINSGDKNSHSDHCNSMHVNNKMVPPKKVSNTYENHYFPTCAKAQMQGEFSGRERLHPGVSISPEYNPHPGNYYSINSGNPRERMKQYNDKKRWDSGASLNSEYNNPQHVNYGPIDSGIHRDRLKQYSDKKRWEPGMSLNSEYKNPQHVNYGPIDHNNRMEIPKESNRKRSSDSRVPMNSGYNPHSVNSHFMNELRDRYPDGVSDEEENCVRSVMPNSKAASEFQKRPSHTERTMQKLHVSGQLCILENNTELDKKKCLPRLPKNQPIAPVFSHTTWVSSTSFIDIDSMRIYRTEDTPILSPSASISDLSSLSFNESFLNNSRNSDCSSDSDEELILGAVMLGMPEAKRAVA